MRNSLFLSFACTVFVAAADLPPDGSHALLASAQRPAVVTGAFKATEPRFDLPEGFEFVTVAAPPLVTHPIMGCVDDRGRLFVGDAVGVNWNKEQLEANPPNRVLLLEDQDGDGRYDRSTVFADKMTFPQGAAWLNGSLYVASPPGIWKLTDADNDGVAEKREMIVGGFDYTGNAADVHGPKVHPNGRLYWCHGRKGHKVTQKDGSLVHEGKASGIWSCLPDGSDVQWHALGCADNPTGLAFTPEGDVIGTCNLYYSSPRGDTLMHWLYGGIYERADQMQVIADLPRTLEKMPIIHNFGHVAVSGCAFGRPDERGALPLYVTHFNTQRLVRMDLTPQGASFKVTESEFLKVHDADVHLTDVIEDRDGSLLVVNTGGWFRIGCPSSLMAKPDMHGSIYRIRPRQPTARSSVTASAWKADWQLQTEAEIATQLESAEPRAQLHALAAAARQRGAAYQKILQSILARSLEPVLEHAALAAALAGGRVALADVEAAQKQPLLLRRLLTIAGQQSGVDATALMSLAAQHLDAEDVDLARTALNVVIRHSEADERVTPILREWVKGESISPARLRTLEGYGGALLDKPQTQQLLADLLAHQAADARETALRVLASQPVAVVPEIWLPPLRRLVSDPNAGGRASLLLDALKRLKRHPFDPELQALAADTKQPMALRLKALDATKNLNLSGDTLAFVEGIVRDPAASAAARIQASTMLAAAPLDAARQSALAPLLASAGPVELKELLALLRRAKNAEVARELATALAQNPALSSQQESHYRTLLSAHPPEIFEQIIRPALERANAATEAKKRRLPELAERAAKKGRAERGRELFAAGKGTCIACHKIGVLGRDLGPNLSKIGSIRTERDLLESILFPSNTLARDYETHLIETRDGQSTLGVIRGHAAEGLLVMDMAGQEKRLAHDQIVSNTTLETSLMPMGLDQTLPEEELLDLVAWLRSLR